MNQQEREVIKQAFEMLWDNHHLVADNEKHAYVMLHLEVIEKVKALLEQPADHCEDVRDMVRPQNCGTGYCSCIECPFKKGGA